MKENENVESRKSCGMDAFQYQKKRIAAALVIRNLVPVRKGVNENE